MQPFYVTTPIYYVNDKPHIGHAYSTVAADVWSRYARVRGRPTYFLTGLDEHGLKIERRATELGMAPQAFVDQMAEPFESAWRQARCEHDDFIRTTEPRHKERAQRLWRRLEDAGDIYLGHYEDWYCVGCESFKTEKELLPGNLCPQHKRPVERIQEESYFFRLSRFTEPLLAFYEANPRFVQPVARFNEVKAFVREGLRDLSVSRTSFRWGVPVPGNDAHVMYVWLDALTNYISALGGPAPAGEAPLYDRFWGDDAEIVHIVGKDILRFHAVYWPAFLLSARLRVPTRVWAHGWLTVNGEKMSKGLGNFLPPGPLIEAFGADVLRYYFMREVAFGQDGDFSHQNLLSRYHGELGNGLGNLLNRLVSSIVAKHLGGVVPRIDLDALLPLDRALIDEAQRAAAAAAGHIEDGAFHRALDAIWELVGAANRYVDTTAPWKLAKAGETTRLQQVSYVVLESLRWLSLTLWPILPDKCDALRAQLGVGPVRCAPDEDLWPSTFGALSAGTKVAPGAPLFPRFTPEQEAELLARLVPTDDRKPPPAAPPSKPAAPAATAAATPAAPAAPIAPAIAFDDFAKVDLRVGHVRTAEKVPKSAKLFRLMIDLGEGAPRQVLAGLAAHYAAADLVGKRVVVVANLAPRTMMGLESRGMVLAATDAAGALRVVEAGDTLPPGARLS
ncbi:MAG: methionine--tRNA ligase [Myxococcales bacterium]|nr:methionine--tRNA ligase [Myxococcales bacterium]